MTRSERRRTADVTEPDSAEPSNGAEPTRHVRSPDRSKPGIEAIIGILDDPSLPTDLSERVDEYLYGR
jgi:hypothetical protein